MDKKRIVFLPADKAQADATAAHDNRDAQDIPLTAVARATVINPKLPHACARHRHPATRRLPREKTGNISID
jgi:2,4-dienoyl-CoA reductase-like NADH-dependent reductase (Old Yellow Enzyme family)